MYINAENCQTLDTLRLDDVPLTRKCTNYWVSFQDQAGKVIVTDKKAWITDFQITEGQGKCDFNFKVRNEEAASVQLNDWLSGDVLLQLHQSQPKVVEKKLEDDSVVKSIVIGDDGLPEIEESVIGVSFSSVNLITGYEAQYFKNCL